MRRCYPLLTLSILAAVLMFSPAVPAAQAQASGTFFNQRDDQYTLLGLKRAKEAFEVARTEYQRQQGLFDKQLIAQTTLDRSRQSYADAEVNYQQSLLAVLFEQQYVTVTRAMKYQGRGNRKRVRLELANPVSGGAEFEQLIGGVEDELFRSLQPDVVHDVYVSLLNDENSIISLPYEAKIEQLNYGEPATIDFALLQDMDAVTVNIIYGRGSQRSLKVYLQKDATVNLAAIQAEQFSQEVELGASTDYSMSLELFSGVSNTFKLEAVNLPSELNRYFVDPATDNRLSQFQFTEGVNTRQAALRVFLPERPSSSLAIDEPMAFYAVAIPRERAEEIGDLSNRTMTQQEIEALNVGFVRLELIPRGVGEILVRAQQLLFTITPDETVEFNVEVVNEGTRRLDNIRIEADPPLNWIDEVTPNVVPALEINEEKRITLRFTPPPDVSQGRYEVRIRTSSLSDDQPIEGEDKTVTIQVEQEANVFLTLIIILLIIGLVGGIVVFGIRLSRR